MKIFKKEDKRSKSIYSNNKVQKTAFDKNFKAKNSDLYNKNLLIK